MVNVIKLCCKEKVLTSSVKMRFESIKHINEYGNEYWYARELMKALEYSKWSNFVGVIDKAKRCLQTKQ